MGGWGTGFTWNAASVRMKKTPQVQMLLSPDSLQESTPAYCPKQCKEGKNIKKLPDRNNPRGFPAI